MSDIKELIQLVRYDENLQQQEYPIELCDAAADELAALEAERDEWKKRAEQAAHIKEGDAVGFDWNVLTQIESLEAVAKAARDAREWLDGTTKKEIADIHLDLILKLDALKGAE